MPLYEYMCGTCDNVFERLERRDAPRTTRCGCGETAYRTVSACSRPRSSEGNGDSESNGCTEYRIIGFLAVPVRD